MPSAGLGALAAGGSLPPPRGVAVAAVARARPDGLARLREDAVGGGEHLADAVDEPVVDLAAAALARNQATVPQARQVRGGVGLRQAGRGDDVAHAPLTVQERFEDAQAAAIGEAL